LEIPGTRILNDDRCSIPPLHFDLRGVVDALTGPRGILLLRLGHGLAFISFLHGLFARLHHCIFTVGGCAGFLPLIRLDAHDTIHWFRLGIRSSCVCRDSFLQRGKELEEELNLLTV
jgi:hypothetical protein